MAKKDIKFTLDTIDSNYSPVGTVKQLDSVFFYIKITENGVTKDLTGQTIKLFAVKGDKKLVEQTTKINTTNETEGLVEIELLNSAIQVPGFTYFELEISDNTGIISTSDFILRVDRKVGSDEAIESTNEVATLKEIEIYVAQAKVELQRFKELQTEMLRTNETINSNEEGRVSAEEKRVNAENKRALAEEERGTLFTQKEEERGTLFAQKEVERDDTFAQGERERNERFEEAESDRAVAESERVIAEQVREEKFAGFESKISSNTKELKGARTATTGENFDTLDERIDCEVDRLNKKIEVSFLQQEDKENHTIENTVDGMTTDMVIKSRTLQNIFPSDPTKLSISSGSISDGLITINAQTNTYGNMFDVGNILYKTNTKYSIIIDILENTLVKSEIAPLNQDCLFIGKSVGQNSSVFLDAKALIVGDGSKGRYVIPLETISDFSTMTNNYGARIFLSNVFTGGQLKLKIMILEGDWTNKPIPEYFEGIKSFGQQEGKISILSNGKNFVKNLNDYIEEGNYVYADPYIYFPIYYPINSNNLYCSYYCNNLPSGSYLLLTKRPVYNVEYQDVLIANNSGKLEGGKIVKSKTLNENNSNIIYLGYAINGKKIDDIKNYIKLNDLRVQLEIGTNKTEYVCDYDKKDILLQNLGFDEGLRGINSISDEINYIRKVAIKRIGKREYRDGDLLLDNVITNKVNTYYVLDEPIETPLDESIALKIYNEKTYVNFENAISGTSSFKAPVNTVATIARLNRENRALEEENRSLRQDFESTTLSLTDSDLELVKQNVDMDFRLMEVEFALDIPQAILSSNINFKNKKGEVKSMARTPYEMMKIVILSGDYDREDYIHKVGKYYERGRMTKEEHDELMSLMTADEVISK
ncbi:TPA: BppU family phage baseplate upper protein [Clostridium perfringens]